MKKILCITKAKDFLLSAFFSVIFSVILFLYFDYYGLSFRIIMYPDKMVEQPFFSLLVFIFALIPLFPLLFIKGYIANYNKFKGKTRYVSLNHSSITFPRSHLSFEYEKINLNTIRNVYFSQDRHGNDQD
jgi:hypothetical protein